MSSMTTKSLSPAQRFATIAQIKQLREELEDIQDSIDILEARLQNDGKRTYSVEEVRAELAARRKALGNTLSAAVLSHGSL